MIEESPNSFLYKEGQNGDKIGCSRLENGYINYYSNGSITTDDKEALKLCRLSGLLK